MFKAMWEEMNEIREIANCTICIQMLRVVDNIQCETEGAEQHVI